MQRIVLNILWASFLTAVAALAACLAISDAGKWPLPAEPVARIALYVLGFLWLWLCCAVAAGLAQLLNGRSQASAMTDNGGPAWMPQRGCPWRRAQRRLTRPGKLRYRPPAP